MKHVVEVDGVKQGVVNYTAYRAIRLRCVDCANTSKDVKECWDADCSLYALRFRKRVKGVPPLKQIRRYCLWCMCGSSAEVKTCPSRTCFLFPYRLGHKPRLGDYGYLWHLWGPPKSKKGHSEGDLL